MVVADSGPLIALARLDMLALLPDRFETILVPEAGFLECTRYGDRPGLSERLVQDALRRTNEI